MAYDADLADRIRELLADDPDLTEKRLFGGLAFLIRGNMAVAASAEGGLLARIDPQEADAVMAATGARPMEMRGRPTRGWLRVDANTIATERQLAAWVERSAAYARSLPGK